MESKTPNPKSEAPTCQPQIGIIMGSDSEFGVHCEVRVVSAHRTPLAKVRYARTAHTRGLRVIIAGAGRAAHLPGMVASLTLLSVIGVPVESKSLTGLDSLLSIVQMPGGVPVATFSISGGRNAGLLAVRILCANDPALRLRMVSFQARLAKESRTKDRKLRAEVRTKYQV